jgi:GNAT superfamily N-acetyltransferase
MGTRIVIVDAPALREEVYRFRYDIYVREMRRTQRTADHADGRIVDALDDAGILLAALDPAGRVIGTLRGNMFDEPAAREYERLYQLELSDRQRRITSLTTRLMIAPRYRGSGLALALARARFRSAVDRGSAFDYIDCNDHLVPLFSRLGYQEVRRVEHPDYGLVNVMMCTADTRHLEAIRSPLVVEMREVEETHS